MANKLVNQLIMLKKYKKREGGKIDDLPYDCLSIIILFFSTPKDLFSLCLVVRGFYDHLKKYPLNCKNIEFRPKGSLNPKDLKGYFSRRKINPVLVVNLKVRSVRSIISFSSDSWDIFRQEEMDMVINSFPSLNRLSNLRRGFNSNNNCSVSVSNDLIEKSKELKGLNIPDNSKLKTLCLSVDLEYVGENYDERDFFISGSGLEYLTIIFPRVLTNRSGKFMKLQFKQPFPMNLKSLSLANCVMDDILPLFLQPRLRKSLVILRLEGMTVKNYSENKARKFHFPNLRKLELTRTCREYPTNIDEDLVFFTPKVEILKCLRFPILRFKDPNKSCLQPLLCFRSVKKMYIDYDDSFYRRSRMDQGITWHLPDTLERILLSSPVVENLRFVYRLWLNARNSGSRNSLQLNVKNLHHLKSLDINFKPLRYYHLRSIQSPKTESSLSVVDCPVLKILNVCGFKMIDLSKLSISSDSDTFLEEFKVKITANTEFVGEKRFFEKLKEVSFDRVSFVPEKLNYCLDLLFSNPKTITILKLFVSDQVIEYLYRNCICGDQETYLKNIFSKFCALKSLRFTYMDEKRNRKCSNLWKFEEREKNELTTYDEERMFVIEDLPFLYDLHVFAPRHLSSVRNCPCLKSIETAYPSSDYENDDGIEVSKMELFVEDLPELENLEFLNINAKEDFFYDHHEIGNTYFKNLPKLKNLDVTDIYGDTCDDDDTFYILKEFNKKEFLKKVRGESNGKTIQFQIKKKKNVRVVSHD